MLAGLSQSMTMLIAFRALQGVGAGMMMPISQAIIGDIFTPAERGKYQGLLMAVFGLSTIVGPTVGGFITDNLSWHWVFYVNVPFAVLFGTAFLFIESRAEAPTIPLDLFRNRIFTASVIITFLTSMGMFGAILYIPLFVQAALGDTATSSGLILTPMMLAFIVVSIASGLFLSRTGRYKLLAIVGTGFTTVGMFLLGQMSAATDNATLLRNMLVLGVGLGTSMSLFTIVVQNAFPVERLGVVTASLAFFRSIGGVVGVAVLGSVMTNRMTSELQAGISTLPPAVAAKLGGVAANPQALMDPAAQQALKTQLAALGPQASQVADQVTSILRGA